MADPTGTNLTSAEATTLDNESGAAYALQPAQRLRQLREDVGDISSTYQDVDLNISSGDGNDATIRVTESGSTRNFQGGYIKHDGGTNTVAIGVHNAADSDASNDVDAIVIDRSTGNVTIHGTTTTVNATTLTVDDKNIELAHSPSGAALNDAGVDGGGITLKSSDGDKTIVWKDATDSWTFNQSIALAGGYTDINLAPTTISTAHMTTAGSFRLRCSDSLWLGDNDADAVRIGRTNTALAKVYVRSGGDNDLVVSDSKVGIGVENPSVPLEIDGDIKLSPTAISTAHITTDGSLTIRADANMLIGDSGVDSIKIGRTNTGFSRVHVRSGGADDFVVTNSKIGIGTNDPGTQVQVTGESPYMTLKNSTAENGEGGCESRIIFEDHADAALGQIETAHSGTADDTKGKMTISTHDGSSLQTAIFINDSQKVGIRETDPDATLHVTDTRTAQMRLAYDGSNTADFTVNSNGDLTVLPSGADLTLQANTTVSGAFIHGSETKSSDGAISPLTTLSLLDSSGATCRTTLANGATVGTMKIIICKARTNIVDVDATMTSAAGSASTFTFDYAGGMLSLIWTGAAWQIMGYAGGSLS